VLRGGELGAGQSGGERYTARQPQGACGRPDRAECSSRLVRWRGLGCSCRVWPGRHTTLMPIYETGLLWLRPLLELFLRRAGSAGLDRPPLPLRGGLQSGGPRGQRMVSGEGLPVWYEREARCSGVPLA